MKIAIRGGHNPQATGASGLINELTEDRKVKDAVIKYLRQAGQEVLDVTPGSTDVNSDLAFGVNKANSWGADLFLSIHFNKAYNSYNGALGSEVCVYNNFDVAQRTIDNLATLGFKNRGQKVRTGLYELRHTNMKSMIVECCFVEATEDVALYHKLGADTLGKKIAEAIVNGEIGEVVPVPAASGTWCIDDVNIDEKQGVFLKGWTTDSEIELVVNGVNHGKRDCDKKRDDVQKVLGFKGYGFDYGIVKAVLKKGNNTIELRGKSTTVTYSFDWLW